MKNLRENKIFTVLFVLTVLLTLGIGSVFAAETEREKIYIPVNMSVKDENGTELKTNGQYTHLRAGDKITVTASCKEAIALKWSQNTNFMKEIGSKYNEEGMAFISYLFDSTDKTNYIRSTEPASLTITIPNLKVGVEHYLVINAVAACDGLPVGEDKEYQATSGTFAFRFTIPTTAPETTIAVNIEKVNSTDLKTTAVVKNGTFSKFLYHWDNEEDKEAKVNPCTIKIPNFEKGSTHTLTVKGFTTNGKTDVETYKITMPNALTGDIVATCNGETINNNSTTEIAPGSKVSIFGSPAENFTRMDGNWKIDNNQPTEVSFTGAEYVLEIPGTIGQTVKLTLVGSLKDGGKTTTKVYYFTIPTTPAPQTKITASIKPDGETKLKIDANVENGEFSKFVYFWDNEPEKEATTKPLTITIPEFEQKEVETTHTLTVKAYTQNGKVDTETYVIKIPAKQPDEPFSDDLIIEDWMREDNNAEGLLVSLRNASEDGKANENFYEIEEEVIYYVDYKNCGKDINVPVKIVLQLPLDVEFVRVDGGSRKSSNNTITWTFSNGLQEDECGTKEVVIKYLDLSKSSYEYEIVYPTVDIYKDGKHQDASTVINYIYLSEDTVITDEHEPYMFGDKEKPTFRPDDTISRAEGALVLTRIFGINTKGAKITTKYSDINETYLEAQRAISAASELGIIEGYSDGTYRPNDKMTRAEFMKIIASYIEVCAEDEEIDGLEVKEDNIKVYKNSRNKNHWAIPYVTLLTRLNMTSVRDDKNLRLDDEITRAEVAQLVNFYSFRAPAKVSSSYKIGFIDVNKKHDLYADIVEATREVHEYVITSDGRERAK